MHTTSWVAFPESGPSSVGAIDRSYPVEGALRAVGTVCTG